MNKTCAVVLLHDETSTDPVSVHQVITAPDIDINIDAVCYEVERDLIAAGLWNSDMWVEVITAVSLT